MWRLPPEFSRVHFARVRGQLSVREQKKGKPNGLFAVSRSARVLKCSRLRDFSFPASAEGKLSHGPGPSTLFFLKSLLGCISLAGFCGNARESL